MLRCPAPAGAKVHNSSYDPRTHLVRMDQTSCSLIADNFGARRVVLMSCGMKDRDEAAHDRTVGAGRPRLA